jgi:hypothetical protein
MALGYSDVPWSLKQFQPLYGAMHDSRTGVSRFSRIKTALANWIRFRKALQDLLADHGQP